MGPSQHRGCDRFAFYGARSDNISETSDALTRVNRLPMGRASIDIVILLAAGYFTWVLITALRTNTTINAVRV